MELSAPMSAGLELSEALIDLLETEFIGTPYATKTRVNLIGKEIIEFMVNKNGAVRYFVFPYPEYDELIIKTAIKQLRNELK